MFTLNERILWNLRRLNSMSRRKGPVNGEEEPARKREHGRGRMLAALADEGEMSQCQLASRLDIRPQSLSELAAKAEEEGLVSRRQSGDDRRQTLVSLTEEGRARVAAFREAHSLQAAALLAPLTEEEKETFLLLLDKLIAGQTSGETRNEGGED